MLPEPVAVDLNTNVVSFAGQALKLTPLQTELVFVLANSPDRAPIDRIIKGLWGAAEPDNSHKTIHNTVCKVRPKLATIGLEIIGIYSDGYRLAPKPAA